MSRDKQIDIPESEMGMSGYSTFAWKLWEKGLCTMAEAEQADQIMRQLGYRKASEVAREIFEEIEQITAHSITSYGDLMVISEIAFAELKKKYTENW